MHTAKGAVHASNCPPSKFGFNASRALSDQVSLDCKSNDPNAMKSSAITSGFSLKTLLLHRSITTLRFYDAI